MLLKTLNKIFLIIQNFIDTDRHKDLTQTDTDCTIGAINNDTERMTMYRNKKGGFDLSAFIVIVGVLALCFFLS